MSEHSDSLQKAIDEIRQVRENNEWRERRFSDIEATLETSIINALMKSCTRGVDCLHLGHAPIIIDEIKKQLRNETGMKWAWEAYLNW
jgi:hypothetical protein